MVKGKLILICQSGGEFVKNDDGSLKYEGGEAHAVNVNSETLFDDLKLKLAEMCNLAYETVTIKYFLPGNTRTLITLSNDKDLKRMLDFHGNSVTADVFVTGREGFSCDALNIYASRETGLKIAESVDRTFALPAAATPPPADTASPVSAPTTRSAARRTAAPKKVTPLRAKRAIPARPKKLTPTRARKASPTTDSIIAVDAIDHGNSVAAPSSPVSVTIEVDMSATPADTVKKRRRTASWRFGANGPTIVADLDDAGESRSRKRNFRDLVAEDELVENDVVFKDHIDTAQISYSDDVSLEKLVTSWKDGITGIGQDFESASEFRDALQKYAIAHRFVYRLKKNDSNRVSGRCVVENCSWRIHASWVQSDEAFRIKKFEDSHTCGGESWKSAHPTKNWLVNIIKDRLQDSPHQKPKEIANGILRDFGIQLNYTQVWRGIEDAREQLQGSYKSAYNQLTWYCEKIIETNPGSFVKLEIGDDKRFRCFFVSFHASIQGFTEGCRPLLFLESLSLRSKNQEVLLTATALDGNDTLFPVAFAVVDIENDNSWQWFFEQLKSALATSNPLTFVYDREKGLRETLLKVFENAYHGYSMYHLLESFKRSLKGPFHGDGKISLPSHFVAAAHAIRPVVFDKFTEQIKQVCTHAYDWVMQIEPECWTSTSVKGERHNHITQYVADSYMKLMGEVRELPITQKIESLRHMIAKVIDTRRMDGSKWTSKLTPVKQAKLQEETADARSLRVLLSSDTLFEVHDDATHVVNLNTLDCTCLGWQAYGIPCRHAVAVFRRTNRNAYDYCSRYFTVESFCLTYAGSIFPVPVVGKPSGRDESESDSVEVLPPCPSRSPGSRPPIREVPLTRIVVCTRCKEAGHNKASCKAEL